MKKNVGHVEGSNQDSGGETQKRKAHVRIIHHSDLDHPVPDDAGAVLRGLAAVIAHRQELAEQMAKLDQEIAEAQAAEMDAREYAVGTSNRIAEIAVRMDDNSPEDQRELDDAHRGLALANRDFVEARERRAKMEADSAWFKARMAEVDMSLRDFAKAAGINQSAVSLTINGKRKITPSEVGTYSNILRVSPEEILRRVGVEVRAEGGNAGRVRVDWSISEDGRVVEFRPKQPRTVQGPVGAAGFDELRAAVFKGGPWDGWLAFWKHRPRQQEGVGADAVGRWCVVALAGTERGSVIVDRTRVFAKISRSWDPDRWDLLNMNGEFQNDVELFSAWPVEWMRQG